MSCSYNINNCSSKEYGLTCETCFHMDDNKYLANAMQNYDKIQKWKIENGYNDIFPETSGTPTDHEDWINEFRNFCIEINRKQGTLNPNY